MTGSFGWVGKVMEEQFLQAFQLMETQNCSGYQME